MCSPLAQTAVGEALRALGGIRWDTKLTEQVRALSFCGRSGASALAKDARVIVSVSVLLEDKGTML